MENMQEMIVEKGGVFSIGSAKYSDFKLDDPYVAPVHCTVKLSDDGDLVLNPAKTDSGVWLLANDFQQKLSLGGCFRIGGTYLRYESRAGESKKED